MKKGESVEVAYCGVCCEHCGMRERIPRMAIEMKRFIDAYRYAEWIDNVSSSFDFGNFAVGLE